jgi:fermentation-respiration switch protein FrsA (DUF1100 family)
MNTSHQTSQAGASRHRRWPWVVAAVVIGVVVLLYGVANYFVNFALAPSPTEKQNNAFMLSDRCRDYPQVKPWMDSLRRVGGLADTFIVQSTGERHHAYLIRAPRKTNLTAVVVHGYTNCAMSVVQFAWLYHHLLHYNVVMPDLHAHGMSEGKGIQMGWKDRLDVLRWVQVADSLYADSTGHSRIVVHGLSMGAATTMALSGEKTPDDLKAYVEDCGFSSVDDEFRYELHELYGLPSFPIIPLASALCQWRYGWSFGEASMVRQVSRCHKPMLFIHGGDDHFVPTRMVYVVYKAKPAPKELYVAPGSHHAQSFKDHPKAYASRVVSFCHRYVE